MKDTAEVFERLEKLLGEAKDGPDGSKVFAGELSKSEFDRVIGEIFGREAGPFKPKTTPPPPPRTPESEVNRIAELKKKATEDGYKQQLESPLVKLAVHTMRSKGSLDAATTEALLRSIFEAGVNVGIGVVAIDVAKSLFVKR